MKHRHLGLLLLCTLAVFIAAGKCRAQLPQTRLDRIFPLGCEVGSQITLEIAGKDLDEVKTLHFDHPGLKAELVKPNEFRVTVSPQTPLGTHEVRAVGKYGISGSRVLAVTAGLTEVREVEPNNSLDQAQAVPMNVAVNGQSDANGHDFFRFPARKGERITIECQAYRLDSQLRAVLTLFAPDGRELARGTPYYARTDPLIDFTAPADGPYIVGLHDATYTGDLPYRLVISNRPHIENAFPPAVMPGQPVDLEVRGRNLPGGRRVAGEPLEVVTVPFVARHALAFSFIQHPPSSSLNARGLQAWPQGIPHALNPVTLVYSDSPVTLEREPNDTPATAQALQLPTVVCGRFDRPGDADWFSFTAKANDKIAIDLYCDRLQMPGDPFVAVRDAAGKELEVYDDHGNTVDSLSQSSRDPVGVFTAPADGVYHVLVQERNHKGGPRYVYALRIGKPQPDFYPIVYHETPTDPTCPVVRQGGSAFYEVCLNRRDGFDGPVTVEAEGLPPGVTCSPLHISSQTEFADLIFTAAVDAPEWSGPIRLKAWATIDGKRLERPLGCSQRRWADGTSASRACREICLAVRSRAPYSLTASAKQTTVAAGGKLELRIGVERNWPDFRDKIQLSGLKLPPGFELPPTDLPAEQKEVTIPVTLTPEVPPGTYTLALRGEAQVPFQPDPKAADKPNVRVADPSTPVQVVVTAAAK